MSETSPKHRYRIVVRGRLSERFAQGFPDLAVEPHPGQTALSGAFEDQAALHGFLGRLQDLGIELVSLDALD